MKDFKPSSFQVAIRDWFLSVIAYLTGNSSAAVQSAIVSAVPGSGKTTTLVWLTEFIPSGLDVTFLSFGRNIVATLRAKCPRFEKHIVTYNALGYRAIRERLGKVWIKLHDGKKVPNKSMCILWEMFPKDSQGERGKEYFAYSRFVTKLVSLAKNAGIAALVPDTHEEWLKLVTYHALTLDSKAAKVERAIEIAQDVLRTSNEWSRKGKLDFDDQLYLVALWDLDLPKFHLVLVDEYQDTNLIQQDMLLRMKRADGKTRFLLVGDEKQGIYGFRGADAHAMARSYKLFDAIPLALSVCYRCAKAIVDNASAIFPEVGMQCAPNATDGKVEHLDEYAPSTFQATDAILCRNVAPLIRLAFRLILSRVACHVLGREIGEGIVKLIERMDATDVSDLQAKLSEYREREVARLAEKNRAGDIERVNDECDCIALFISNLVESDRTLDALKQSIVSLFSDRDGCLTLATIHKAKGLEWQRVYILDYALIPSQYAKTEDQLAQEKNLQWVANTRAQEELYFITSEGWTDSRSELASN